jgi:hypothetical protein
MTRGGGEGIAVSGLHPSDHDPWLGVAFAKRLAP